MLVTLSVRKKGVYKIVNGFLVDLPTPSGLSYMWNFGSLLGVFVVFQFITGIFLAIHYSCSIDLAFDSVTHIERDVNWGWLNRVVHSNGASVFFMMLYLHIGRGIYYGSYFMLEVWMSGVTIFIVSMAVAFLGYVLPWGQMSFWAATVITNLLSAVPVVGIILVEWVWGGYAVSNPTLTRFFSFHFLLPFILLVLVVMHLYFLHEKGSSSPFGVSGDVDKVSFWSLYGVKDLLGFLVGGLILFVFSFLYPYIFMDVENFMVANSLVTPVHIQPEWYFLFAYAVLRSVPNSIGGVVALLASVAILYVLPFFVSGVSGLCFSVGGRFAFWWLVSTWILLTWCGSCVVEDPFVTVSMLVSVMYFGWVILIKLMNDLEEWIMI